jgi:acyl-CoA thioesterase-1
MSEELFLRRLDLESESKKHRFENRIVIVAMGDSLTVGYQSSIGGEWVESTPYTSFLEKKLLGMGESQRKKLRFQIDNKGVSGELTGEMLARFDRDVTSVGPDFVIILGGSNDLGWGISPRRVFNNLVEMYEAASASGIQIIACSVPSILGYDSLISPRIALNDMIRGYCIEERRPFADLFRATADRETNRLLDEYSNDGLHLSTLGYQRIADAIYEEALEGLLLKHLSQRE